MTSGQWRQVTVAGKTCDEFEPDVLNPHGFVVVYLHGVHLGRLHENEVWTREFSRHGLPLVAPHTGRSWWTDRICDEFDERISAQAHVLGNVVPYLAQRWQAVPPRIALLGTSMGGQGALRLAFKFPDRFPIVAAIAPAIDYQIRFDDPLDETIRHMYPDAESVRQDTAVLHVHPLNWPRNTWFCSDPDDLKWHDSAERLHMKLAALGIPHECDLETSAGGHSWGYYNHMGPAAIDFLARRLDFERRRVT